MLWRLVSVQQTKPTNIMYHECPDKAIQCCSPFCERRPDITLVDNKGLDTITYSDIHGTLMLKPFNNMVNGAQFYHVCFDCYNTYRLSEKVVETCCNCQSNMLDNGFPIGYDTYCRICMDETDLKNLVKLCSPGDIEKINWNVVTWRYLSNGIDRDNQQSVWSVARSAVALFKIMPDKEKEFAKMKKERSNLAAHYYIERGCNKRLSSKTIRDIITLFGVECIHCCRNVPALLSHMTSVAMGTMTRGTMKIMSELYFRELPTLDDHDHMPQKRKREEAIPPIPHPAHRAKCHSTPMFEFAEGRILFTMQNKIEQFKLITGLYDRQAISRCKRTFRAYGYYHSLEDLAKHIIGFYAISIGHKSN